MIMWTLIISYSCNFVINSQAVSVQCSPHPSLPGAGHGSDPRVTANNVMASFVSDLMCQVCLFVWLQLFSQLPLQIMLASSFQISLWFVIGLVHALRTDDWDIIIQVLVTCSEAVNDWEISGIIRPITAGITQSSNLRRGLQSSETLITCQANIQLQQRWQEARSLHWLEKFIFSFIRIWNPLSPEEIGMREIMRIFGELITDSEIFCLGWKISTFPKLLRTPQGCRAWSRCGQLTGDKGH